MNSTQSALLASINPLQLNKPKCVVHQQNMISLEVPLAVLEACFKDFQGASKLQKSALDDSLIDTCSRRNSFFK
jgi:hypothetical protein